MDKTKLRKIIVCGVIAVVVLGYDIFPFDIIPDIALGAGQIDDIIVTILGVIGTIINIAVGKSQPIDTE